MQPKAHGTSLLHYAGACGTRLGQALANWLGILFIIDGRCRRSVSLPDCSGACDHRVS